MQVSAAEGRLLVVATKSGATLGDPDQKELEDLINKVLEKAEGGSGTGSPEAEQLFEQYIRSDFLAAFSVSILLVVRGDTHNDCL